MWKGHVSIFVSCITKKQRLPPKEGSDHANIELLKVKTKVHLDAWRILQWVDSHTPEDDQLDTLVPVDLCHPSSNLVHKSNHAETKQWTKWLYSFTMPYIIQRFHSSSDYQKTKINKILLKYLLLLLIWPFWFVAWSSNNFSFMNINTNLNQLPSFFQTMELKRWYALDPWSIFRVENTLF